MVVCLGVFLQRGDLNSNLTLLDTAIEVINYGVLFLIKLALFRYHRAEGTAFLFFAYLFFGSLMNGIVWRFFPFVMTI